MRLRIVTPMAVRLDAAVTRVVAETPGGAWGLLPRHADFVAPLRPGILTYETEDGAERYAGLNAGTLVKRGDEVMAATREAILGENLETLHARVREAFMVLDDQERAARAALARLEAGMIRRFMTLTQEPG